MKTKTIHICIIGLLAMLCTSCNDWLTVQPKSLSPSEKMFESETGFKSALTGLYLEMRYAYTPGDIINGGLGLEYMANDYAFNSNTSVMNHMLSMHNYTDQNIDRIFGYLFMRYYKIITNASEIINNMPKKEGILTTDEANLIEGEALAIRAFCHFELMRIWGPVPGHEDAAKTYLPYVTTMTIENYPYLTYQDYMQLLLQDLTRAEELLAQSDPILKYTNAQLNAGNTNLPGYDTSFWYKRQTRFNVYGVKALLARYYLWMQDNEKAYAYAKEVLDAKNEDGTPKFVMGKQADIASKDYLFSAEHIIGVTLNEFVDNTNSFISTNGSATYVNTVSVMDGRLYGDEADLRKNLLSRMENNLYGTCYGTLKYSNLSQNSSFKAVPLVRLSEMYLILCETAPLAEANTYYKAYREARNTSYTALTDATRQEVVLKEYVKEYFAEGGQSFFTQKRMNRATLLLSQLPITTEQYVVPIPTAEYEMFK